MSIKTCHSELIPPYSPSRSLRSTSESFLEFMSLGQRTVQQSGMASEPSDIPPLPRSIRATLHSFFLVHSQDRLHLFFLVHSQDALPFTSCDFASHLSLHCESARACVRWCVCVCVCVSLSHCASYGVRMSNLNLSDSFSPTPLRCEHAYFCMASVGFF